MTSRTAREHLQGLPGLRRLHPALQSVRHLLERLECKTYHRTDHQHPVLGVEYQQSEYP